MAIGDLETTHLDTFEEPVEDGLMPSVSIEEQMDIIEDKATILKLEQEVEELKKRTVLLNQELEERKKMSALTKKNAEDVMFRLESSEKQVKSLQESLVQISADLGELADEKKCMEQTIINMEVMRDSDAKVIENQLIWIGDVKRLYGVRPPFVSGWKLGIADWLTNGSVEDVRKWFVKLYAILHRGN